MEPEVDIGRLNRKLIPYNIIIVAVSIACLITLIIGTTWKISLSLALSEEMVTEMIGSAGGEGGEGVNDIVGSIDFSVLSEMDPLTIEIKLPASSLLNSLRSDGTGVVSGLITPLVSDLLPQVNTIFKTLIKVVAKTVVNTAVETALAEAENASEEIAKLDIDMSGMDTIIDEFFEDEPDIGKIKNELSTILEREINKSELLTAEEKTLAINEMQTGINEQVDALVTEYGDENGTISGNAIIYNMLGEVLNLESGETVTPEQLGDQLSQMIAEKLNEQTLTYVKYGLMAITILFILIPAAAWGLLALFAFLRIFRKNKGAYLGFARAVGWIPFAILVLLPTIALPLIAKAGIMPTEGIDALGMINGKFFSTSIVSFIGSIVLMLLSWFGYRKTKKQIKRARRQF